MWDKEELDKIREARKRWEEGPLKQSLDRFGIQESPFKVYTPLDVENHDFLKQVGFPGQPPYTRGLYPMPVPESATRGDTRAPAGAYAGYGTVEDTRDLWRKERRRGANVAFDLPTQCGYDSDDPMSRGEVGKVGVAVSTLQDFETLYEAFDGIVTLDNMSSNWTINGLANVILAMYIAIAEKKGIPESKLRGTPQNDILKEFVARGTANFPVDPSMRMVRDTITYVSKNMPQMNAISICGFHMREMGATAAQINAFVYANAIAYVQLGVDAGLDPDVFVPRHFTLLNSGGSMDFFMEIARIRSSRRMWPKIMRERFNSKNPRAWFMRSVDQASVGYISTTKQRAINNLTRGIIGGVAAALSGGMPNGGVPFDEPLGLGHSYEAQQLSLDAARIMRYEARLGEVLDPLAGSYYVESLTDQVEEESWEIMKKIDEMGGAVEAVRSGWMEREITKSAYAFQREVESGKRVIVGVNRFTGEHELDMTPHIPRLVPYPYDPAKRARAEEVQIAKLAKIRKERDNDRVKYALKDLQEAAKNEKENLIPHLITTVKTYATIGEITNALREVFGDYEPLNVL
jgi:methylmalonyl-CoA mutase N-terminal domain/subunit